MPALNADIQLEISTAESQADALGTYLQGQLSDAIASMETQFSSSIDNVNAQLAALTDQFTGGIQSAAGAFEADFNAGIASATDQLSLFDAGLATAATEAGTVGDALAASVAGGADTALSALDDQLQQVGDSAQTAGDQIASAVDPTGTLATGADLATGKLSGLTESLLGIGGSTAVVVGGVSAVSGSIYELYKAGSDAASAEERFNAALGIQAQAVQDIHIGNLNIDLARLAGIMGSTTTAMQNAVTTTYQFAQNAGASEAASVKFSQELYVLAARAVSLKPSLGDVSDVATSMETGLGRAKAAAAQFGISVSQAEINARALSDTGKESASALTAYEKSVAGAEIALMKYGGTLNETVTAGSQNAAIQQRALAAEFKNALEEFGKPLVAPMLDAIRAGLPDIKQFGMALGELAQVILPPLATVLRLIEPAIQPAVVAFGAFYAITTILPAVLSMVGLGMTKSAAAAEVLAAAEAEAAVAGVGMAGALEAAAGPIGWIIGGIAAAATLTGIFGQSAQTAADQVKGFSDKLAETSDQMLVTRWDSMIDGMDATKIGVDRAHVSLVAFKQIAEENTGAAQRLVTAMFANGQSVDQYQHIVDKAVEAEKRHADAKAKTKEAADALTLSTKGGITTQEQATSLDVDAATKKDKLSQTYDKELKAINGVNDALLAQYDKTFAAIHADESARDALDKLNSVYDDTLKKTKDVDAANEAQARQLISTEEAWIKAAVAVGANAEANSASLDPIQRASEGVAAQKVELGKLMDTLAPDSPLRVYLQGYIDKLTDPALTRTYVAQFRVETHTEQLDDAAAQLFGISSYTYTAQVAVPPPGRMAGGPVDPYGTYVVGEAGPELLHLGGVGGTVTPNSMILGNTDKAGIAPHQIQVVVNVTAAPDMSNARAEELGSLAGAAAGREVRAVIGSL